MSTLALHAGTERPYKGPFLRRLKEGFQDKDSRQYFGVYLAGKMIGLLAVIAIAYLLMKFLGDRAFGEGNGWIGHNYFFLQSDTATYGTTGVAFLAFFLFQFAFADTCSTITSGAMVGRTGFKGDLLYSIGVSGFIYPILGHWVWGPGGWLGNMTLHPLNSFTHGALFR